MSWPPADTFRNRFLYGVVAGVGALVTVYFLLFALQTGAFLPWAVFTLALAATLVAGLGLALIRATGIAAGTSDPDTHDSAGTDPARTDPADTASHRRT